MLASPLSLTVSCVELILGRRSYGLAALNTVYGLLGAAVFMTLLSGADTFNFAIGAKIGELLSILPGQILRYGRINLVFCMGLIALAAADVGVGRHKAYKSRQTA